MTCVKSFNPKKKEKKLQILIPTNFITHKSVSVDTHKYEILG